MFSSWSAGMPGPSSRTSSTTLPAGAGRASNQTCPPGAIVQPLGQQVEEGLHRDQGIADLVRDARRQRPERGEPVGALEHRLRAAQLARERGVLERDAGAGRDRGEELEVLGGEDAEVPVAAESDEPGRSIV